MTTPIRLNYLAASSANCLENGAAQPGSSLPPDQSTHEPAPDYAALIEAELKAFQKELQHIERALAIQKELVRDWHE